MRSAELALASGYSVQQIRQLESRGVIPTAMRESNGYRSFASRHLRALLAYRDLASALGPLTARDAMRRIQQLPTSEAASLISGLAFDLEVERRQVRAARTALISIHEEADAETAFPGEPEPGADSMTITELSLALGVRASTLRHWESEELVKPDRVPSLSGRRPPLTARIYRRMAIRDARITSALRLGGYRIPEIREAVWALRNLDDTGWSLAALDERAEAVARRTLALFRAGSVLVDMIDSSHR